MNIFPSLDTGLCQTTVRTFNERAADLENTAVLCVSADLPPAAARFCGAEGIENVITGSTFKNPEVLEALGVKMLDGKLQGLAARSVVVLDTDGTVLHSELVPEIARARLRRSDRRARLIRKHNQIVVVPGPQARASRLGSAEQVVDTVLGIAVGRAFLVAHRAGCVAHPYPFADRSESPMLERDVPRQVRGSRSLRSV